MLCKEWIPADFYKYICKEEHLLYLNGKNVLYPKIAEIVWKFINKNKKNYNQLRNDLCQFKEIFQYVYSIVYSQIYCTRERCGFDLKSIFQLVFKSYKYKKRWTISLKNQAILQKKEMKHLSLNKNLWKLTFLITQKKKKLMKKLKKEKKTWNSWKKQTAKTKKKR